MSDNEGRAPEPPPRRPQWAAPALPAAPTRAERRAHTAYEIESRTTIRVIWDEVCENTGLTARITSSGCFLREPPVMGPITLGPPTRFSIALRPGQIVEDIAGMAHRLAVAYRVDDVVVRQLTQGWVSVVLVEHLLAAPQADDGLAPVDDGPSGGPRFGSSESRSARRRTHLGSRDRRRPFGRPRSFGG